MPNSVNDSDFVFNEQLRNSYLVGRLNKNEQLSPMIPMVPMGSSVPKPFQSLNIGPGINSAHVEDDTSLRYNNLRDSERPVENSYVPGGFKGFGAQNGEVKISNELRYNTNISSPKTGNPQIKNFESHFITSSYAKLMGIMSKNLDNRGGVISRDDARE